MKQRHIAALLAEFIGTFVLVMVVLNVSRYGLPFFTAIGAALAIAGFTSIFIKISGGNFNPAITLGLFSIRKLTVMRTIAYLAVQFLAALAAWQLYEYFTQRTLKNATTPFDWRILIAEGIGALIFGVIFAGVVTEKLSGYQAAATVGIGLFLGATVAGLASAGLINPAVALGTRSFDVNYLVGPIVGAIVGMNLFVYAINPALKSLAASESKDSKVEASSSAKKVVAKPAKKATTKKSTAKKTTKK